MRLLYVPSWNKATAAWNPHTENDIKLLEAIQRQAVAKVRFICGEYGRYTSITPLLNQLNLDLLATSHLMTQCAMFFKHKINLQFPPSYVCLLSPHWKIKSPTQV